MKYSSLRILAAKAVGEKFILQQGDFKNAFFNATLPNDEITVIRPPIGDPYFKTMSTGSLRKFYMDYIDTPIIGAT